MNPGHTDPSSGRDGHGSTGAVRVLPRSLVWGGLCLTALAAVPLPMLPEAGDGEGDRSAHISPPFREPRAAHRPPDPDRTRAFLARLDIRQLEHQGTDYGHPRFATTAAEARVDTNLVRVGYDRARLEAACRTRSRSS